jgi:hypothetical protein
MAVDDRLCDTVESANAHKEEAFAPAANPIVWRDARQEPR